MSYWQIFVHLQVPAMLKRWWGGITVYKVQHDECLIVAPGDFQMMGISVWGILRVDFLFIASNFWARASARSHLSYPCTCINILGGKLFHVS